VAIPVNARRLTRGAWGAALLALAGFAAPVAAEEENWRDFTFEDKGFAIQFPIQPTREEVRYRAAVSGGGEVEVPATRITVTQDHTTYDVTVAEFTGTAAADPDAIDYAVERLRKRGPTGLDTLVSIANGECGRYIGYADPDGTLNYYGLFYFPHNQRFYDIHARVPPSDQSDHGAGASHFGLSLNFLASAAPPPPPKPDWPAEWKEYIYTNPEFSIRFPAAPKVESLKFRSPAGVVVPARRFSLRTGDTEFRVTAAKYWQSAADTVDTGQAALAGGEQWARAETARGRKIVYDRVASLSRAQCGRELRSSGPVEKHVRVFFPATQHWLYIVEAAGPKAAADRAALFQAGFAVTAAPEPAEVPPQQPVEQQ
jgi:hypothetical protein